MKHLLTTLALFLVGSIAAFGSYNFLRITTVDGDVYYFSFEKEPEISIQSDGLKVTMADSEPTSFSFENFSHFDFTDEDPTAVEGPTLNMGWNAGTLTLSDLAPGTIVSVYTLDGKEVLQQHVSGTFTLPRNSLPKGIYILKAGNFSVKIII